MMAEHSPALSVVQRWMQAVIQHPGGVADGVMEGAAQTHLAIQPDELPQVIYADAYFARLLEVLAHEFPTMRNIVGEELFATFAAGYLQVSPSTSYTLGQLGTGFPAYLTSTRPPRESDAPDWYDFVIDCCQLERLYSEVFDGPGPERNGTSPTNAFPAMSPEVFVAARLRIAPWVRLIALHYPVHESITAARHGDPTAFPGASPTWLIVSRRDFRVRRVPVSAAEFLVLSQLQNGATIGAALEALAASQFFHPTTATDIESWFRNWTAAGYILGITTAEFVSTNR
jgi:hypothetical protein